MSAYRKLTLGAANLKPCASLPSPNTASSVRCISRGAPTKARSPAARSRRASSLPGDYVEQILLRLRRAGSCAARAVRTAAMRSRVPRERDLDSRRDRGVGDDDLRSALRVASGRRRALLVVAQRAASGPCGCCCSERSTTCSQGVRWPTCLLEESDVRTRVGLGPTVAEPDSRALPVLQP